MTLVWEGESQVHCIVEHHRGHLYLFTDAAREGVPVDSHYLMQSVVESSGPNSWKVKKLFVSYAMLILSEPLFSTYTSAVPLWLLYRSTSPKTNILLVNTCMTYLIKLVSTCYDCCMNTFC